MSVYKSSEILFTLVIEIFKWQWYRVRVITRSESDVVILVPKEIYTLMILSFSCFDKPSRNYLRSLNNAMRKQDAVFKTPTV